MISRHKSDVQIIESISFLGALPAPIANWREPKDIEPESLTNKVTDPMRKMNIPEIIQYLDQIHNMNIEMNHTVQLKILISWSTDPIGHMNKCPAMGDYYHNILYLGKGRKTLREQFANWGTVFTGYLNKQTNNVMEF